MKKQIKLTIALALTICLCSTAAFALDGSWINTQYFPPDINDWSTAGMWADSVVAGGSGYTAFFTNGIAVGAGDSFAKGISMGTSPTISHIVAGFDVNNPTAYYALVAGTITLVDSPTIDVADESNCGGLVIGFPGFGGSAAGTDGFTKTGTGRLFMDQPSPISGPVALNAGYLHLRSVENVLPNADVAVNNTAILRPEFVTNNVKSITINTGGVVEIEGGVTVNSDSTTVKSGGKFDITAEGTVASGSKISVEAGGSVFCDDAITFTVNNNIDLAGWGSNGGAIEIFNTVANGTYNGTNTITAPGTRVFSHGAAGSMTFNGPFAGNETLSLIGQAASPLMTKVFNMNVKNIHNGATSLETFACDTTYEIGVNDCFPTDQALVYYVHNWGVNYCDTHVDMNDYTQTAASLVMFCGAVGDEVELRGNVGSKVSITGNVDQSGGTATVNTCELEVGGILTVDGTMVGMNNVTLLSGASIKGIGKVAGTLTIPTGATVAPGNSIGTIYTDDLTMEADSSIDWEVGDPVSADLIDVNGTLDISAGINLNLIDDGSPDGSTYTVANYDSVTGDDTDITVVNAPGAIGVNLVVGANSITIDVIPEPATFGLIAILGLAFLRRKK